MRKLNYHQIWLFNILFKLWHAEQKEVKSVLLIIWISFRLFIFFLFLVQKWKRMSKVGAWETRFSSTVKTNGTKIIRRTRRKLNGKRNGMKINGKRHLTWKEYKKKEEMKMYEIGGRKSESESVENFFQIFFSTSSHFFISYIIFLCLSRALIVCHSDDIFARTFSSLHEDGKKMANYVINFVWIQFRKPKF